MKDIEKQELEPVAPEQAEATESATADQMEPTTSSDSPPKSSKAPLFIALLALMLALGGSWMGYQKWVELRNALQQERQTAAKLKEKQNETKGRLDEFGKTISAQHVAFTARDEVLKQERAKLEQKAAEMEQSIDKVFQRIGRSGSQWIVAEAEYLMRIANHRLQLEGDAATAMVALQGADGRLRDSGDPVWTGVREKLASEVAELQALKRLDLAGQASKLAGLISQVEKLKLPHSASVVSAQSQDAATKPKEFTIDTVLKDGWEGFKSLMVIRHNDRPITAMLEPDQRFFLYQNLRLQLEAARLALLRREQTLLDASLQRAEAWIKEFFDQEHSVTKTMQARLVELRELEVAPKIPDISGSLRMLLEQRQLISEEQKGG